MNITRSIEHCCTISSLCCAFVEADERSEGVRSKLVAVLIEQGMSGPECLSPKGKVQDEALEHFEETIRKGEFCRNLLKKVLNF